MRQIPIDKLDYILSLIDVKFHKANNVYVLEECNSQIEKFEKEYKVCFINTMMFIEDEEDDNN